MHKITNKSKKIRLTFIAATFITYMILVISFSWFSGIVKYSFVNNYYTIFVDGKKAGSSVKYDDIERALKNARKQINSESTTLQYVDADVQIKKSKKVFAKTNSSSELCDAIYSALKLSIDDTIQKAYVVDIDGYILTMDSLADVEYLFNSVKDKYDNSENFCTDLQLDEASGHTTIKCSITKADIKALDIPTVGSDGTEKAVENTDDSDGTTDVKFGEKVEIVPCYVNPSQINELNSAINMVSSNPEKSELSVVVTEKKTYNLEYGKPTEYVYNENLYNTEQNVLVEGSTGVKKIVANITYKNGSEIDREIVTEDVINEAVAKVIEIGTAVPPSFIKPIYGGTLTSTFGFRWGTIHKGVDWSCSVGTNVMASCDGTVVQAGWNNSYGYYITIKHRDGKSTRYAHLSQILVYAGQTVAQSEVIGLSGNTGDSTGPHIHFEILEDGIQVNPFGYLD